MASAKHVATEKSFETTTTLPTRLLLRQSRSFAYERPHPREQLQKLLVACFVRWLTTVVLCVATYVMLWHYSSKTTMVTAKKKEFNTLITGLTILLSLNLASSLKHMIATMRWWVLSLQEWQPIEVDLILQSENISRMLRLLPFSKRYRLRAYVLTWVMINVIGLATLGLVYNVNGADKVVPTRPGIVSFPTLSTIETVKLSSTNPASTSLASKNQSDNAIRYTANSYGLVGLAAGVLNNGFSPPPLGLLFNPEKGPVSCQNTTCWSWFYEATPPDQPYYLMAATNRYVATESSCRHWKVTRGGAGNEDSITVADGRNTSYRMPTKNGPLQTTFIVDPHNDQHIGWSLVTAFEASFTDPWLYRCNVSLDPVVNAVLPEHHLGDGLKLMAPAAIALQGYGSSPLGTNVTDRIQFQSYPAETFLGSVCGGSDQCMGFTTSAFAAAVILATAQSNSMVNITGQLPLQGVTLDINHWSYVHLILGLIMGLQLLFSLVIIGLSNRVMVRDHSHFGEAALLRSTMHQLSYRAVMCNEREIASLFPPTTTMKYVPDTDGVYYIRTTIR